MVVGDEDCCAIKTCGHGEIWHPTCCQRRQHRFVKPLIVEGKVILVGDRFYYDFPGEKDFPKDPKGWIRCTLSEADGPNMLVVKPLGFEKFMVNRNHPEMFKLVKPVEESDA